MITEIYHCDGCNRKLKGESLIKAKNSTISARQVDPMISASDLFCPEQCVAFAAEYWDVSRDVHTRILEQASAAVTNFRKRFFQERINQAKIPTEVVHGSTVTH